jgi:hypothetical protein
MPKTNWLREINNTRKDFDPFKGSKGSHIAGKLVGRRAEGCQGNYI